MAGVRGIDFVDAVQFVRDGYGASAHERVLAALPADARGLFAVRIRDAEWYPLNALVAYLRTAHRELDPKSGDFFRRQGYDAAQRRRQDGIGPMVDDPAVRVRMAPTTWRLFYDVGRLVVVPGPTTGSYIGQIHDFPVTPELCERFCGIWEGLASTPGRRAQAEEMSCVRRGDAYCAIRVRYLDE